MSKSAKVIENPEVPGFEENLPPLPPGSISPPQVEVKNESVNGLQNSHQVTDISPAQSTISVPSPMMAPYFSSLPDAMISQLPPSQPPQPVPWWIPTDDDGQDPYAHQWYDLNQKQCYLSPPLPPPPPPPPLPSPIIAMPSLQQPSQFLEKNKNKGFKRKNEVVDPAEDAQRVASAQRELSALMKPLKCDLCNAVMNSTLQAKLHYDGKPHQKKVSMFLNQSVKKPKVKDGHITDDDGTNDWNTYCAICKTWFTSPIDAAQHYAGKKHNKATTGSIRQKSQKQYNSDPLDPTGRFGIGLSFVQPDSQDISYTSDVMPEDSIQHIPSTVLQSPTPPTIMTPIHASQEVVSQTYGAALHCDLCGVSTNRYEQLETHKRGARHQKMLRLNGLNSTPVNAVTLDTISSVATITANTTATIIDYSIYRTPSGSYYCAPCNKSFNSENSFAQHVESKKHKNQVNPKSPNNQTGTSSNNSNNSGKKNKTKKSVHKISS